VRPHAFPRSHRILRKADFDAAFRDGHGASDGLLKVVARRTDLPHPRLGLAVGKATGDAVRRNRVKRLLREAFRLRRADLPAGFDLVVVPKADDAAARTLAAFEESLVAVATRAAARAARAGADRPPRAAGAPGRAEKA
jgi:ribonuclease P protein component